MKMNVITQVNYELSSDNKIMFTTNTRNVTSFDLAAYVGYEMRRYLDMGYDVISNIINNDNIIAITKRHKIYTPTTIIYTLDKTIEY